jgi:hypothetical protein
MRRPASICLAFLLCLAFAGLSLGLLSAGGPGPAPCRAADVYVWPDEEGVLHFTNKRPEQAGPPAAEEPADAREQQPASSDAAATGSRSGLGFLWKISGDGGHAWLLGSVHMAKPGWYPLASPLERAFQDSGALVLEADVSQTSSPARAADLLQMMSGEDMPMVEVPERLKGGAMGLPLDEEGRAPLGLMVLMLELMKYIKEGYRPDYGIDKHFFDKALDRGMPVKEIEGVDRQLRLMAEAYSTLDKAAAEVFMQQLTAEDPPMLDVLNAWREGDWQRFKRVVEGMQGMYPGSEQFFDIMYSQRNRVMADAVADYASVGQPHFVAVGAAHLPGEDGILELLRRRGFDVEQVLN